MSTRHGDRFAKCSRNAARFTGLLMFPRRRNGAASRSLQGPHALPFASSRSLRFATKISMAFHPGTPMPLAHDAQPSCLPPPPMGGRRSYHSSSSHRDCSETRTLISFYYSSRNRSPAFVRQRDRPRQCYHAGRKVRTTGTMCAGPHIRRITHRSDVLLIDQGCFRKRKIEHV